MANNENYEKDSRTALINLLAGCGWREIRQSLWEKSNIRLLVDWVGVFLFRWSGSRWLRTHGLAHNNMRRIAHTREMVFVDGARLNLECGEFTLAPVPKKKKRLRDG